MNGVQYISLKDLGEKLQLSQITLRRYIKDGKLNAKKIGREYKILPVDAEKFINSFPDSSSKPAVHVEDEPHAPIKEHPHIGPHGLKLIPGLNSHITEALIEMANQNLSIKEIKGIIKEHATDCLDLISKIENEGITDANTALNFFLIDEAIRNLQIRRALFKSIIVQKTIVILPLPPHLSEALLTIVNSKFVFVSDSNLPPHLRHVRYPKLEHINYEYLSDLEGVTSIALEGYIENDRIHIRNTALGLVQHLNRALLQSIYAHIIPQIPPNTTFVELPPLRDDVKIMKI